MIYSVFVPSEGKYHYYETPEQKAVNADLPVPSFPSDAGKIGVAAMDAARSLPSDARKVGEGWTARGILASPNGTLAGLSLSPPAKTAAALALGGGVWYAVYRSKVGTSPSDRMLTGALLGAVTAWFVSTR